MYNVDLVLCTKSYTVYSSHNLKEKYISVKTTPVSPSFLCSSDQEPFKFQTNPGFRTLFKVPGRKFQISFSISRKVHIWATQRFSPFFPRSPGREQCGRIPPPCPSSCNKDCQVSSSTERQKLRWLVTVLRFYFQVHSWSIEWRDL